MASVAIGFLVGAGIGVSVCWLLWRSMAPELRVLRQEREELTAKHQSLQDQMGRASNENSRLQGELRREIAVLETALEHERKSTAEKLAALNDAREAMVAVAREAAASAASQSGTRLLESFEEKFKAAISKADANLAKRQESVQQIVAPIGETLKELKETVQRVDAARVKSHAELGQQLKSVAEAEKQLRSETGSLAKALSKPHVRGRWGEMHLRRLAELSGLSPHCDFSEQRQVERDDGRIRPDMVVHLPGGKDVVVDSKVPLDPYLAALQAEDDLARAACMKTFAGGVRSHIRALASKRYAAQLDSAPDFVVLYLPGEHFFAAACEADPSLIDDAAQENVLIATPTSLIVLLKTVAYGWQQERVAEQAQVIAGLGRRLYERLGTYLGHVENVGRRLASAVEAHNKSVGSLEQRVLPAAREFPGLGTVALDDELPHPQAIQVTARQVQAGELNGSQSGTTALDQTST